VHVVLNPDTKRGKHLAFTLFNEDTKHLIYSGVYRRLGDVVWFTPEQLKHICKNKLEWVQFERSPFKNHIKAIQQAIDDFREKKKYRVRKEILEEITKEFTVECEVSI